MELQGHFFEGEFVERAAVHNLDAACRVAMDFFSNVRRQIVFFRYHTEGGVVLGRGIFQLFGIQKLVVTQISDYVVADVRILLKERVQLIGFLVGADNDNVAAVGRIDGGEQKQ